MDPAPDMASDQYRPIEAALQVMHARTIPTGLGLIRVSMSRGTCIFLVAELIVHPVDHQLIRDASM